MKVSLALVSGMLFPKRFETKDAQRKLSKQPAEMQGAFRSLYPEFYVEAIVGADNKPSQRVAEQVISATLVAVTDKVSGLPAYQYLRKIEPPSAR